MNGTPAMLDDWTQKFGLSAPVLGDRGWGLSMYGHEQTILAHAGT